MCDYCAKTARNAHNVSGLPVPQPLQTYPCFDKTANISNSETWLPYQFILCFYKL